MMPCVARASGQESGTVGLKLNTIRRSLSLEGFEKEVRVPLILGKHLPPLFLAEKTEHSMSTEPRCHRVCAGVLHSSCLSNPSK